ncbi:MAG: transposase [Candidatus Brocadiales bacterium]|nr:transposase [Candidatus Brocadiales bacterium]
MPNYRRAYIEGGTYFFTVVTYNRNKILCTGENRENLKISIKEVCKEYPFIIDAWVLLPDHVHCIWTLPRDDNNFSIRWQLIKRRFTIRYKKFKNEIRAINESHKKRGEKVVWQRRFWEHLIRDERDFERHCDYIHYNPVKHGYVTAPKDWEFSTFHSFVKSGIYDNNWGARGEITIDEDVGNE